MTPAAQPPPDGDGRAPVTALGLEHAGPSSRPLGSEAARAVRSLRRLWPHVRPHRGLLLAALAAMLLLGLTTGAYAFLIGPALRFLLTGGTAKLELIQPYVPALAGADRARALWGLPLLIVLIAIVKGFAYLWQFYAMGAFGHRIGLSVRRALFVRYASLSPVQLSQRRVGDLLSRLSGDVAAIEAAANYTVGAYLRDGVQIAVLLVVAFVLEWRVALATLVVVPVAVVPVARLTRRFMGRTREAQALLGGMAAQVQEGLGGIRTIQAFDAQAAELSRFDTHARAHLRAVTRAIWARAAVPGLMELLAAVAIALAFSYALGLSGSGEGVAPDRLVSLLSALILLYQPAKELGRVGQLGLAAAVAAERLHEVLELPAAVPDRPGARALPPLSGGIAFDDVWYAYPGRSALRGASFELPVGKVTALVGPSGGGKSTVVALLMRAARPDRGTLRFAGVDADEATVASVRAQLAVVTQEALLLSATVLENLRLARPDAPLDAVVAAARSANADGFIRRLPQGYDTPIGERGVVLSGGQKQRLALARALLAGAPLLVLDEATSNLDPEGEREVQEALSALLPGRTALVIAHRLSSIRDADQIVVLDAGQVVERGRHADLLARGGLYARLWRLQDARPIRAEEEEGAA